MEPAQHRECRFTVQLPNIPIVMLEDELAGEENAARKFSINFLGELGELFDRVDPKGKIRLGGETAVVAIVHEIGQRLGCLLVHPLQVLAPAVTARVDRPDIHENAIPELAWELAPPPFQRENPAAAARADDEHRSMTEGIERRRIGNVRIGGPAERLVGRADLSPDERVMAPVSAFIILPRRLSAASE